MSTAFSFPTQRTSELPPVVNAPLESNVSASQVKLYDRCARLWWLNYVGGVREKRLHHFVLGESLHSVGERFLLGQATCEAELYPPGWNAGLTEDESLWISRATRHAIETGVWQLLEDAYVEFPILFLTGAEHVDARGLPLLAAAKIYVDEKGVRRHGTPECLIDGSPLPSGWNATPPFVGFIDLLKLGQGPAIIDHKSAKSRKYASSPKKLAEDLQVLSYAAVPLVLDPTATNVRLRHNVFLKCEDTKIAYAVDANATLQRVLEQWQHNRAVVSEMVSLRTHFPKDHGASPFKRAKHWIKIRSAIDENRPDACREYSGCPFRDACAGLCSIEAVVQRLDAPAPPSFVQVDDDARKPRTFGLNLAITAKPRSYAFAQTPPPPPPAPPVQPAPKDPPMFTAPKLTVGNDGYILDPSNPAKQYRCRVLTAANEQGVVAIALWPNQDTEPNFEKLGAVYRTDVPQSGILAVPSISATIVAYEAELVTHNVAPQDLSWEPAAPQSPMANAGASSVVGREPPDGRFGLVGVQTPGPAAGPAAVTAPGNLPGIALIPIGTILRVAATDHPFWAKLKGKLAKVGDMAPGEHPGSTLYTVEIDGHPYPDVDSKRFEPVPVSLPAPTVVIDPVLKSSMALIAFCGRLVGKNCSIEFKDAGGYENRINAKVEKACIDENDGISVFGGTLKVLYSNIITIRELTEGDIPGVTLPKGPGKVLGNLDADTQKAHDKIAKAQEKAAKKEAKANKSLGAVPTAPATVAAEIRALVPASTEQASALDTASDVVHATLNGGKVTRKVLEALVPLLANAKAHQADREAHIAILNEEKRQGAGLSDRAAPTDPRLVTLLADIRSNISRITDSVADIQTILPY